VFDGVVQSVRWRTTTRAWPAAAGRPQRRSDANKTFEVVILIDTQGQRFFSGLSADAEIEIGNFADVVKVPSQAVLARPATVAARCGARTAGGGKGEGDGARRLPLRRRQGRRDAGADRDERHDAHAGRSGAGGRGDRHHRPYKVLDPLADGQVVKADGVPAHRPPRRRLLPRRPLPRPDRFRIGQRSYAATHPVIQLENITKVYKVGDETIRALDGVSLEVGQNDYVAVMGTSGSGKSTLMNILGCLDRRPAARTGSTGDSPPDGRRGPGTARMSGSVRLSVVRTLAAVQRAQERRAAADLLAQRLVDAAAAGEGGAGDGRFVATHAAPAESTLRRATAARGDRAGAGHTTAILLADEPTGNSTARRRGDLELFAQLHRRGRRSSSSPTRPTSPATPSGRSA
jgi:putative ABC transport system ATP-binding protein